ncbi:mRNA capping enzyme [Coprinopsis marcescibilis]|uniref:mRNA-capping enzyme subunit beta n=1 Tax=Coprinopsis marcescibilis TaxID=230819 RepID=A0A5C3L3Q1_COPMA|nr:mRNA capping enzyme [Coprinopsis marcescibilis]
MHHSRQQEPGASSSSAQPGAGDNPTLPPLSLSILGVEPLDEFIKEIADFVHHMIVNKPEGLHGMVEVEAKIGVLKENASGTRMRLPVLVESILAPDTLDTRFESNMSSHQHRHYRQLLSNLGASPSSAHTASPLECKHLVYVDSFYKDPDASPVERRYRGHDKIRVTRDEKTNTAVECVKKLRLGDLNIYSPKRAADWRVSVNLEMPVKIPTGPSTHTRRKDRLRYRHEEFVIDLTQVVSQQAIGSPQTTHELELEIARAELLVATAAKRNDVTCSEHERSAFDELIRAFVNNARILVRNSPGFD